MPQLSDLNNSYASGEISDDAWERADLEQIATGCEAAWNFIGLTTGAMVSRGGFWRRGKPKSEAAQQRLVPWNRADGQGLVLELGHQYGRVWTAGGARIETSPGTPYEFFQPYTANDLAHLRFKQIGDIAIATSRFGLLYTVFRRNADTNWQVTVQDRRNGPWEAENIDPTRLLTFTDLGTGSWLIDAWTARFQSQHVDQQILARPPGGGPGVKTWAPNTAFGAGENIISVGRVYVTDAGGTSGNTPPTHDQGEVSDGAVSWRFVHDGATAFYITEYVSPTQVKATPVGTPPFPSGTATPNWSDQAFGPVAGWPTALPAVREERLAMGGTPARPDTIEFTRTAGFTPDYADFKPGLGTGLVVDDDACRVQLGDNRARIVWMIDGIAFAAGTTDAEWVVSGATLDDPISPASVKPRRVSSFGSADVMPVVVQGPPSLILHVAKGGKDIRELQLGGSDQYAQGRDLSILARHITGEGVVEMAWSRPDNNVWLRLTSGNLACLTYHYEHRVLGFRRQPMANGWVAESICCTPDANGQDVLHVAAVRVKGSTVQRAHFVMANRDTEAMFLDCADSYAGPPTTIIGGLEQQEDERLWAVSGGAVTGPHVVTGGQIVLPSPVTNVIIGNPMRRYYKSLAFNPRGDGFTVGKRSRPTSVYVVLGCVEAEVYSEAQDEPDDRPVQREKVVQRRPGDAVPVVRRKREKVTLGSGADRDVRVIVETDSPYDLKLFATRPSYETPS